MGGNNKRSLFRFDFPAPELKFLKREWEIGKRKEDQGKRGRTSKNANIVIHNKHRLTVI